MKKSKVFDVLINIKKAFIDALSPKDMKNHDGKAFTKKRVLTFQRMIYIILRCSPYCLQIRLDDFFKEIGRKEDTVSKQAFSKARENLDPDILKSSFYLTTKTISQCDDLLLYKDKFRLCAIDGSDIALDNAQALKEHFGCSGSASNAATALVSLCYDPLNNIVLDAGLYPYGTSERDAARKHLCAVENLPIQKGVKNLYIFDRGYPSKALLAEFMDANRYFLMRVRKKFNVDFDLVEKKGKVIFSCNGKDYEVKVFNITLDSGEKEILVTNLSGKYLKRKEAKDLYFTRWGIEGKFNTLKNKLELENMSGRRPVTVYQDFWAKLDMANTLSAIEFATNETIETKTKDSDNKYEQTTNENRLISKFSQRYVELLTNSDTKERTALFDELVADIAKRPVEVKPGRNFVRKIPRKMKFCDRAKRVLR